MKDERDIVDEVIAKKNKDWLKRKKYFILETGDTIASMSEGNAIETIIDKLEEKKNFVLYIGLMGSYFGTPTKSKENRLSGTYEEFLYALKGKKTKGFPDVKFFFSNANVEIEYDDDEALEQLHAVRNFRKELRGKLRFGTFDSLGNLRETLSQDLSLWFDERFGDNTSSKDKKRQKTENVPEIQEIQNNPLMKNAPILLCFTDPKAIRDGKERWEFTEINNDAWKEILGYDDKTAIDTRVEDLDTHAPKKGLGLLHLIHPSDRVKTQAQMNILMDDQAKSERFLK